MQRISAFILILFTALMINAQTTTFTYQGRLNDTSVPANGAYLMQFKLYEPGGAQVGATLSDIPVTVADGIFTVQLDFGSAAFNGADRFLEIAVRRNAGEAFVTLSPRQPVTSAPYAIKAKTAETAVNSAQLGGLSADQYVTGQVVRGVNNLNGNVTLEAGANVTITPNGNTLTISATGGGTGGGGILNQTTLQTGANFNIDGTGKANIFDAGAQFNLGGSRVLSSYTTNLFVGSSSGLLNGGNTFNNTYTGSSAGKVNVMGNNNSFFGAFTGSNTTGSGNSFFGALAGLNTDSGTENSFFGTQSGISNTTGFRNSFFGADSGKANTTGVANAFFGNFAGSSNQTGSTNSFFGFLAGRDSVSSSDSTFIGGRSGVQNIDGQENTFIGFSSGAENKNGDFNTFVGSQSGGLNITGSRNTSLGYLSGVTTNGLSYATAIGAEVDVATSNTVQLGRSSGADTVFVPGVLRVAGLGSAGSLSLCRNSSNQVAACSSSLRYKTNVNDFSYGLSQVRQLKPITFNWKDGGMADIGFGAEDVARVNELLVIRNEKGEVEGVKYDRISTVLVNAVNEQQTQIEAQEKKNRELKSQVETLEQRLAAQQKQLDLLKRLVCTQNPSAEICREER